jgi:hypothetical protein
VDYILNKKLFSTEMDFWRRAARTYKILKVSNETIKQKMGVAQTVVERMEYNTLKRYGHVLHVGDNRWPKGILTTREIKGETTRNKVGKRSGKSDEAERSNT